MAFVLSNPSKSACSRNALLRRSFDDAFIRFIQGAAMAGTKPGQRSFRI